MKTLCWSLVFVFGMVGSAKAQTPPPNASLKVGEVAQLGFDESADQATLKPGLTIVYRAYVDGVDIQAVSGPLAGQPGQRVFALPPFPEVGVKTMKVSAQLAVTDTTKWKPCTTTTCAEAFSAPITVAIVGEDLPPIGPPTNLQIIRTTTVTETVIDPLTGHVVRTATRSNTEIELIRR